MIKGHSNFLMWSCGLEFARSTIQVGMKIIRSSLVNRRPFWQWYLVEEFIWSPAGGRGLFWLVRKDLQGRDHVVSADGILRLNFTKKSSIRCFETDKRLIKLFANETTTRSCPDLYFVSLRKYSKGCVMRYKLGEPNAFAALGGASVAWIPMMETVN